MLSLLLLGEIYTKGGWTQNKSIRLLINSKHVLLSTLAAMADHKGQLQWEPVSEQRICSRLNSPRSAVHFNVIYSD